MKNDDISEEVVLSVLNCVIENSDIDYLCTVREYMVELLTTLWEKEDGFSGKKPFGNSGWKYDVYLALVLNGIVDGKLDAEGFVEDIDDKRAEELILAAIWKMREA